MTRIWLTLVTFSPAGSDLLSDHPTAPGIKGAMSSIQNFVMSIGKPFST